ncbi:HD domain-containing protein [Cantharellus anzutake]|uniref:HD domain-containing protein n=1 Tax=Cantharellus anzutake TaxID=1750568 RepID=UPI001906B2B0|nr:HD domain-containing protein [Cantharellus anzutake]KAF8328401.1 HD domain-containing protein [Cantharellus anzutake]
MSRRSNFVPSGNEGGDRLAFFHILEQLKTQRRTGWVNNRVTTSFASISDHMHRMSILALCTTDQGLDVSKCVMLSVVHDLAEAIVGDIAPSDGIPSAEKKKLEADAISSMVGDMLHGGPAARRIEALWNEYEAGETAEARFVKDLDRVEMALQASEYEKRHRKDLQPFFDSSISKIQHPEVQGWAADLITERASRASEP